MKCVIVFSNVNALKRRVGVCVQGRGNNELIKMVCRASECGFELIYPWVTALYIFKDSFTKELLIGYCFIIIRN